jgi:hypothetical protein
MRATSSLQNRMGASNGQKQNGGVCQVWTRKHNGTKKLLCKCHVTSKYFFWQKIMQRRLQYYTELGWNFLFSGKIGLIQALPCPQCQFNYVLATMSDYTLIHLAFWSLVHELSLKQWLPIILVYHIYHKSP